MSGTDYRSLTPIRFAELFDGRLKDAGIYEMPTKSEWGPNGKSLTDGRNFVWVYFNEEGLVTNFTTYGLNAPQRIFRAIANKLDVDIVSEHEPQYWGFETTEEWEAAWRAEAEREKQDFYKEVVKFVRGESHDIEPETIGMIEAEIAKRLIAEKPELLDEDKRADLIKAVDEIYYRDHAVVVKFTKEQLEFMRMAATHEDDLPQA